MKGRINFKSHKCNFVKDKAFNQKELNNEVKHANQNFLQTVISVYIFLHRIKPEAMK